MAARALALGFTSTIGIIHDGNGQLKPLGDDERAVWDEMRSSEKRNYSTFNHFQEAIANGKPNEWRCRAGARYLYICENGLVHYCSPAARLSRRPAGRVHEGGPEARISDGENVRAQLHHQLRSSNQLYRPLALAADTAG